MSAMLIAAMLAQAAASSADAADGRCVAVMTQLDKQSSRTDKSGLESAMMFFLGKIVGRSGAGAVSPAIEAGAKSLAGADDAAVLDRMADGCIAELNRIAAD